MEFARATFHQVGGQGERRTGEADQGHVAERWNEQTDGLGDRADRLQVKGFDGRHIRPGPNRVSDHRTDISDDVEFDPRPAQRDDDVGEQDRRVDTMPADRLQGDLADQLGVETRLHHGVLGPQHAVFRQRATGLPHEPDRRPRRRAPGGGGQVGRLGKLAAVAHRDNAATAVWAGSLARRACLHGPPDGASVNG